MNDDQLLKAHLAADTTRLDRIESKIDKLSETVISLARAEEKLIALENDKKFILERMVKTDERIESLENKVQDTSITVRVINRLFWIAIVAGITSAIGMLFIK